MIEWEREESLLAAVEPVDRFLEASSISALTPSTSSTVNSLSPTTTTLRLPSSRMLSFLRWLSRSNTCVRVVGVMWVKQACRQRGCIRKPLTWTAETLY